MDTNEFKMLEAALGHCEAALATFAADRQRLRAEMARIYAEGQDETPHIKRAKELAEETKRVCRRKAIGMRALQLHHEAQCHLDNLRHEVRC
jgi:hypothetical protein